MEIDITSFVKTAEPYEFSASRAELGYAAGKITWNNAKRQAAEEPILPPDALDEFRAWVKEFGAWSKDEIAAWDATSCNALLIQFVSGDLRELEDLCPSELRRIRNRLAESRRAFERRHHRRPYLLRRRQARLLLHGQLTEKEK